MSAPSSSLFIMPHATSSHGAPSLYPTPRSSVPPLQPAPPSAASASPAGAGQSMSARAPSRHVDRPRALHPLSPARPSALRSPSSAQSALALYKHNQWYRGGLTSRDERKEREQRPSTPSGSRTAHSRASSASSSKRLSVVVPPSPIGGAHYALYPYPLSPVLVPVPPTTVARAHDLHASTHNNYEQQQSNTPQAIRASTVTPPLSSPTHPLSSPVRKFDIGVPKRSPHTPTSSSSRPSSSTHKTYSSLGHTNNHIPPSSSSTTSSTSSLPKSFTHGVPPRSSPPISSSSSSSSAAAAAAASATTTIASQPPAAHTPSSTLTRFNSRHAKYDHLYNYKSHHNNNLSSTSQQQRFDNNNNNNSSKNKNDIKTNNDDSSSHNFQIEQLIGHDVTSIESRERNEVYDMFRAAESSAQPAERPVDPDDAIQAAYLQQLAALSAQIDQLHKRNLEFIRKEAKDAGYFSVNASFLVRRNPKYMTPSTHPASHFHSRSSPSDNLNKAPSPLNVVTGSTPSILSPPPHPSNVNSPLLSPHQLTSSPTLSSHAATSPLLSSTSPPQPVSVSDNIAVLPSDLDPNISRYRDALFPPAVNYALPSSTLQDQLLKQEIELAFDELQRREREVQIMKVREMKRQLAEEEAERAAATPADLVISSLQSSPNNDPHQQNQANNDNQPETLDESAALRLELQEKLKKHATIIREMKIENHAKQLLMKKHSMILEHGLNHKRLKIRRNVNDAVMAGASSMTTQRTINKSNNFNNPNLIKYRKPPSETDVTDSLGGILSEHFTHWDEESELGQIKGAALAAGIMPEPRLYTEEELEEIATESACDEAVKAALHEVKLSAAEEESNRLSLVQSEVRDVLKFEDSVIIIQSLWRRRTALRTARRIRETGVYDRAPLTEKQLENKMLKARLEAEKREAERLSAEARAARKESWENRHRADNEAMMQLQEEGAGLLDAILGGTVVEQMKRIKNEEKVEERCEWCHSSASTAAVCCWCEKCYLRLCRGCDARIHSRLNALHHTRVPWPPANPLTYTIKPNAMVAAARRPTQSPLHHAEMAELKQHACDICQSDIATLKCSTCNQRYCGISCSLQVHSQNGREDHVLSRYEPRPRSALNARGSGNTDVPPQPVVRPPSAKPPQHINVPAHAHTDHTLYTHAQTEESETDYAQQNPLYRDGESIFGAAENSEIDSEQSTELDDRFTLLTPGEASILAARSAILDCLTSAKISRLFREPSSELSGSDLAAIVMAGGGVQRAIDYIHRLAATNLVLNDYSELAERIWVMWAKDEEKKAKGHFLNLIVKLPETKQDNKVDNLHRAPDTSSHSSVNQSASTLSSSSSKLKRQSVVVDSEIEQEWQRWEKDEENKSLVALKSKEVAEHVKKQKLIETERRYQAYIKYGVAMNMDAVSPNEFVIDESALLNSRTSADGLSSFSSAIKTRSNFNNNLLVPGLASISHRSPPSAHHTHYHASTRATSASSYHHTVMVPLPADAPMPKSFITVPPHGPIALNYPVPTPSSENPSDDFKTTNELQHVTWRRVYFNPRDIENVIVAQSVYRRRRDRSRVHKMLQAKRAAQEQQRLEEEARERSRLKRQQLSMSLNLANNQANVADGNVQSRPNTSAQVQEHEQRSQPPINPYASHKVHDEM